MEPLTYLILPARMVDGRLHGLNDCETKVRLKEVNLPGWDHS